MGFMESASGSSLWRGMEYYENHKVVSCDRSGKDTCDGVVSGSKGRQYNVHIDEANPGNSTCTCAFSESNKIICKHMIALYFTAHPEAADSVLQQEDEWEREEKYKQKKHYEDLRKEIGSLTKEQLQERLYNTILELEDLRKHSW